MNAAQRKTELRQRLLRQRREQAPETVRDRSLSAQRTILDRPEWRAARSVGLYAPQPDAGEIETDALVQAAVEARKTIAWPRVDYRDREHGPIGMRLAAPEALERGPLGIPQPPPDAPPIAADQLDLLIVPGIGFDRRGYRLGHGAGLYDRLLVRRPALAVGLAWSWQLIDGLPVEDHDRPMDALATEEDWIDINTAERP